MVANIATGIIAPPLEYFATTTRTTNSRNNKDNTRMDTDSPNGNDETIQGGNGGPADYQKFEE